MKVREIVMKIGNVKARWCAPWSLTVMGLDLTAVMSVANNPRETLARTAQQTMTALVLLSVALIMFAEIPALGRLTAVPCRDIVRRVREIVTKIMTVCLVIFVAQIMVEIVNNKNRLILLRENPLALLHGTRCIYCM